MSTASELASDTSASPAHTRRVTSSGERALLLRASADYHSLPPHSDAKKSLVNVLIAHLRSSSRDWNETRVSMWMRNSRRKNRDQPAEHGDVVTHDEVDAFSGEVQGRMTGSVRSIYKRSLGSEVPFLHAIERNAQARRVGLSRGLDSLQLDVTSEMAHLTALFRRQDCD
jgi:hypothetical protein